MPPCTVDDYLKLPYTIEVINDRSDDQPGWFARVVELPGCITQADTFEEIGPMIEDAMRGWIEIGLEEGQSIPEPRTTESYSGRFVVRLPRSLHRQLAEAATRESVSLNTFVCVALGRAVGLEPPQSGSDALPHHEIDEQIPGGRLGESLLQIEADIEHGRAQHALDHVAQLRQALSQSRSERRRSPARVAPAQR